ncbi:flavodoxin-dependent (E)-4-hydroxy-3-methylbut-2-enyl-diphosphate synthase [Treponema sp. TIM-1]|uniref:flavodoxin-dependent (E)-4-hydroxy-3-methylbut-2-enyl-diphosphate synthase n=1 Tax=Treponema sp. TIM-1 TaxID=2898417 RepID=UPI0039800D1E
MRQRSLLRIGGFDHVEPVLIGGDHPVVIQTMWKDRLSFSDLTGEAGRALVERIDRLKAMGCGLLRFAVPDLEAAEVLGALAREVSMPLVADIHFDYKIALRCLDYPIAKIRINPGNIGSKEKVQEILTKAAGRKIPIRIGVNAGSLPQDLRRSVDEGRLDRAEALVAAAERELAIFREFNFKNVLVSLKASTIADTIKANRILASRTGLPIHIGVTEAGPLVAGVVRNTAALVVLLSEGIGDTIRVSLSDSIENEVIAGREILGAVADSTGDEERRRGVVLISCPRCGRNSFDTHGFTERWLPRLYSLDKNITVAVMGCAVNGPGEARHADLGITGAGNQVLLFRHGKVIRTISAASGDLEILADSAFGEALEEL